ncbi:MAG: hypothetical protein FWH57_12010 [Oscillospiraceae bacterium]|nr:hypothetical protein [Oscillospiraceae bacterium]
MNDEYVKGLFDALTPSEFQKERMYNKILSVNQNEMKNNRNNRAGWFRHSIRKPLLASIVIVACLALCGTVLAVSGVIDFGSFYNSLFNNPDVKERIDFYNSNEKSVNGTSHTAASSGLEITLLSAVVDRNLAYLTIEIRDTEDARLSDSISVLNESMSDNIHYIATGPTTYNEAENKATLALTVLYGYNVADQGSASLSIDTILSGINLSLDSMTADRTVTTINGLWVINYTVEKSMDKRVLIAYPEDSPIIYKLEVTCTPVMFSFRITAHGVIVDENGDHTRLVEGYNDLTSDEKSDIQMEFIEEIMDFYRSFDDPFLTLDDGSIIYLEPKNDSFDWLGGSSWCYTNYYDIETIKSITFCGEEYFFSGTP